MRITLGYLKMIVYMFFELDLTKDEPLVHFLGFAHLVKTLDGTNEPDTGRQAPEMKMYSLLKMGIFQPAMLVYRSVFMEFQAELWSALKLTIFPRPHSELASEKSCLLNPQEERKNGWTSPLKPSVFKFFFVSVRFWGGVKKLQDRWIVRPFFRKVKFQDLRIIPKKTWPVKIPGIWNSFVTPFFCKCQIETPLI